MNVYKTDSVSDTIRGNRYPGRGIVIGKSEDGRHAVFAYFIMGRSENSRNRVFVERDGAIYTEPHDFDKVSDPSLIIYSAVRRIDNKVIVTNGDQTDTIYDAIAAGGDMRSGLRTREFEPDAPNLTPRISGVITLVPNDFTYEMSILKSGTPDGAVCNRYFYEYTPVSGIGHFIHTYVTDGNPLPTFMGEPERVAIPSDIDALTDAIWESLDAENKISLYVEYIDPASGKSATRMINKNK